VIADVVTRCHACGRRQEELAGFLDEPVPDGRRYCTGLERKRCLELARERIGNATGGVPWLGSPRRPS
jgi:hypothetical protein